MDDLNEFWFSFPLKMEDDASPLKTCLQGRKTPSWLFSKTWQFCEFKVILREFYIYSTFYIFFSISWRRRKSK